MPKIVLLGAGSTVFAKTVLGDCICTPEITPLEITLHDIDPVRMDDTKQMLAHIIANSGRTDVTLSATTNRREALAASNYVFNAMHVGMYDPCTITDFEVPKRYGLQQTMGDTLGIGGIFRGLRTIPVLKSIADDVEELCPSALLMHYSNPIAIAAGYLQRYTKINAIGICNSPIFAAYTLLKGVGMDEYIGKCKWEVAGINHVAWLLKLTDLEGNDLYPEVKRRAKLQETYETRKGDLVRLDIMERFGYYTTESSEHNAEYNPWYIKSKYPELINMYNVPLDEYPRRCIEMDDGWAELRKELTQNPALTHEKSQLVASYIVKAMETDQPYRLHANVQNNGLITNLPDNACVEVPCMIDRNGVNPCYVGALPEQCAAIDRLQLNVQLLTIEAAVTLKREYIYMAAMLDPHTAAELSPDEIKCLCDDLIEAHGDWLPKYE